MTVPRDDHVDDMDGRPLLRTNAVTQALFVERLRQKMFAEHCPIGDVVRLMIDLKKWSRGGLDVVSNNYVSLNHKRGTPVKSWLGSVDEVKSDKKKDGPTRTTVRMSWYLSVLRKHVRSNEAAAPPMGIATLAPLLPHTLHELLMADATKYHASKTAHVTIPMRFIEFLSHLGRVLVL